MATLNDLCDTLHRGKLGSHFWQEVDNLGFMRMVKFGHRLAGTRLVQGNDFVQLCSMLSMSSRVPDTEWSEKQVRWLKMLVIRHWNDLEVILEM